METQQEQDLTSPDLNNAPPVLESPQTPPTNLPPANPTNQKDPYVELLENTVAEQNRRFNELNSKLTNIQNQPTQQPPLSADELRTAFFNNPHEETAKIIRKELEQTISPLREFVDAFKGQSQLDRLISNAKINPKFQAKWTPELESYIRQQAQTVPPNQLTDQNFTFLVVSAVGAAELGYIPGYDATPKNTPTPPPPPPRDDVTPPHLRPSTSPMPQLNPKPVTRELTENERRMYREYNAKQPPEKRFKSEAEFIKWQEMPRDEVAYTDFDKK